MAKLTGDYREKGPIVIAPRNVRKAARHLYNIFDTPPLLPLEELERDGIKIHVVGKFENVNSMYTFKTRGAEWYVHKLMEEYHSKTARFKDMDGCEKPVLITASAGNHAQGVALAANRYGLKSKIYMPKTTPRVKQDRVEKLGAEVVPVGDTFDEALAASKEYLNAHKTNTFFVPPYEHPDIMEGQAAVGYEIFSQLCPHGDYIQAAKLGFTNWIPDVLICPVGGGGLASGIGAIVNEFNEETGSTTKLIGVETESADSIYQSIKNGYLSDSTNPNAESIADGITVKKASERMVRAVKKYVDQVVLVSEETIEKSIARIYHNENIKGKFYENIERKTPCAPYRELPNKNYKGRKRPLNKVEGAAAAGYGAIVFGDVHNEINWKEIARNKKEITIVCVLTGANISKDKYDGILKKYAEHP